MLRSLPVLLVMAIVALLPVESYAEGIDRGRGTVNVGPIASGPVTSAGSAGFSELGTQSDSGSRMNQPSDGNRPPPSGPAAGPGAPLVSCLPGQTLYTVYDSMGTFQVALCVPDSAGPAAPNPSPLQLALEASARQPWPVLQVGINPGTGLTGLASWFWLGGSPRMRDATASAGPLTVTVRATLVDVVWDFGDGAGLSSGTDTGEAFPVASGIRHVYETDTFGRPEGYLVSALLRYRVTYAVNGGPFAELGLKARRYTTSYQVNQLQPQAVSVR